MSQRIYLSLLLILAMPAWSQVAPAAVGEPGLNDADLRMTLPPLVSAAAYPTLTGDETRSNYLRASVAVGAAYIDNAFSGDFAKQLSETTITLAPSIALDRTTPRQKQIFTYSPGFTFYRPTSELDAVDQNAEATFDYSFAKYTALQVTDTFLQTTNFLGQTGAFAVGGSSASGQLLIIPFAEQISDTLHATFSHQYARDQMFGLAGSFSFLNFPNPSQSTGLFNSKTGGGAGFWGSRIGMQHYFGVSYEYTHFIASPTQGESTTNLHAFLPFYTFYFKPTISLSLAAGAQYYSVSNTGTATSSAWAPVANASFSSQTAHTNFNLSYVRSVAGGGGLLGAYTHDGASLSGRLQFARSWTAGLGSNYSNIAGLTPGVGTANLGGHSISGRAFVQRTFGDKLGAELGYERLHQAYKGVALLASNPDSNRVYFSLSYQFTRALGR